MIETHGQDSDPEASSDREAERLLESLRRKGYRLGGAQAVFRIGDSPGEVRYLVNGLPLDRHQLRALDEGRLRLPNAPAGEGRRRKPAKAPTP
jgi:hypothetical protein